jgi:hypothetical protein
LRVNFAKIDEMSASSVRHSLTHAGLILVAFELVKNLVVTRVKGFYANVTFGEGMPFKSYQHDVLARHKDVFEASLLYLRDHMEAIRRDEMEAIQNLRRYRNQIAHELLQRILESPDQESDSQILTNARASLFRLSNYWVYIDVGSDPDFKHLDFDRVAGADLELLDRIIEQMQKQTDDNWKETAL